MYVSINVRNRRAIMRRNDCGDYLFRLVEFYKYLSISTDVIFLKLCIT